MSRESNLQLKVGAFVLFAMGILTYFVVSVTDLSFTKKGYGLQVVFGFVNGLREAAPVRLAGVEIGIVRNLKVFVDQKDQNKTKVMADLWVQEGVIIPNDSKVGINQLGLLGEKYVEIIPGVSAVSLKGQDKMSGKDPIAIEKVTEEATELIGDLRLTVNSINTGILTEENKKSLASILKSFDEIAGQIKHGHGTVGRLLSDDSIYKNLEELTADLKQNPWKLLYRPKK